MTTFFIHMRGGSLRLPLFAIAIHGLTDLDQGVCTWLPIYTLCLLVPLPSCLVTAFFCVASLSHFAADGGSGMRGLALSTMVHAAVLFVGVRRGVQPAFLLMITYLSVVHMPLHYMRCFSTGREAVARPLVAATAVVALVHVLVPSPSKSSRFVALTDTVQRIVVAHIAVESLV